MVALNFVLCLMLSQPGPIATTSDRIEQQHQRLRELAMKEGSPKAEFKLSVIDRANMKGRGAKYDVPEVKGDGVYVWGERETFPSDDPFNGIGLVVRSGETVFRTKDDIDKWAASFTAGESREVEAYIFKRGDKGRSASKWGKRTIQIRFDVPDKEPIERSTNKVEGWTRIQPKDRHNVYLYVHISRTGAEPALMMRCGMVNQNPVFLNEMKVVLGDKRWSFDDLRPDVRTEELGSTIYFNESAAVEITDKVDLIEGFLTADSLSKDDRILRFSGDKTFSDRNISDDAARAAKKVIRAYYEERFSKAVEAR